jgi:hypothetical protein
MAGHFLVSEYPTGAEFPYDIAFQLNENATGKLPKDQSTLKSEAEKTLHVLRALFSREDGKFVGYFTELLALCRYGLVGATAQPAQALDTLKNLQMQIFDNEKGRAISAYMGTVIRSHGTSLALLALVLGLAIAGSRCLLAMEDNVIPLQILAVAPGLFVGLIFSSFIRCRTITFYDLHAIEADRFAPLLKVAFAVAIVLLTGAFLKAELFEIKLGKTQLSAFDRDYLSAFVFGAVVGVAQEAIISRIESIKRQISPSSRGR